MSTLPRNQSSVECLKHWEIGRANLVQRTRRSVGRHAIKDKSKCKKAQALTAFTSQTKEVTKACSHGGLWSPWLPKAQICKDQTHQLGTCQTPAFHSPTKICDLAESQACGILHKQAAYEQSVVTPPESVSARVRFGAYLFLHQSFQVYGQFWGYRTCFIETAKWNSTVFATSRYRWSLPSSEWQEHIKFDGNTVPDLPVISLCGGSTRIFLRFHKQMKIICRKNALLD